MPLPSPKQGEQQNDFIGRCLVDPTMKNEYSDLNQRKAVCITQFKKGPNIKASKPGGSIWETGIHKVSIGGKPVRLKAPEYSLKQNYNLMKRKIAENGHIPIGIDHIPEEVLASNPTLKKILDKQEIDIYNVGKINEVASDGQSIKIVDAEFTVPAVQDLFENGDLEAWSVVENVKTHECPTESADLVADYFTDIKRVDLVGSGGCETCRVNADGVPEGYERLNASFMEVDIVTKDGKNGKGQEDPTKGDPAKLNPKDDPVTQTQGAGEDPNKKKADPTGEDPKKAKSKSVEERLAELTETVVAIGKTVTGIVDGTIEAKLPEKYAKQLEKVDDLTLEASKAKVGALIDAKIKSGTVKPAMKEGLMEAGLAMPEEAFKKHLATYEDKIWDDKMHASFSERDNVGSLNIDAMRKARQNKRF